MGTSQMQLTSFQAPLYRPILSYPATRVISSSTVSPISRVVESKTDKKERNPAEVFKSRHRDSEWLQEEVIDAGIDRLTKILASQFEKHTENDEEFKSMLGRNQKIIHQKADRISTNIGNSIFIPR